MNLNLNDKPRHLYIAVTGRDENVVSIIEDLDELFHMNFGDSARRINEASDLGSFEIIYEVDTPVFDVKGSEKEFFSSLHYIFEDLSEYCAFFTQFNKEDN